MFGHDYTKPRLAGLVGGVFACAAMLVIDSPLQHINDGRPARAAAVAALMGIWWLTEALPIYATAAVPLFLFPLLHIYSPEIAGNLWPTIAPFLDPYIFLFAGGMAIAAAMQQWDLHLRIALHIMQWIGSTPSKLLFGFLASTAFISMWISNTATAAMMLPIGIAIVAQLERQLRVKRLKWYGMAVMLSIAYGANIGGIGTKIGTAPNAQFAGFMERMGTQISFLQFMAVGLPFVLMMLPIAFFFLNRIAKRDNMPSKFDTEIIDDEMRALGKTKGEEEVVLTVFLAAAGLWVASKPLTEFFASQITAFKVTSAHVEASIAMLAGLLLMLLKHKGRHVLEFKALKHVPWETLLLLGGSFAMAAAIQQTGMSDWLGSKMTAIKDMYPFAQVMFASIATVGITAVASNTATVAVALPILRGVVSPALISTTLFSSTISASCDFALPAGTPPNAIVFGSGYVTIPQMARTGFMIDVIAAILSAVWCWVIVDLIL